MARLHAPKATLWIAAERLPQFRALWPDARLEPAIAAPAAYAAQDWSPDAALVEIVRGRLEGQGPVTQDALAAALGLATTDIAPALAALEAEGFALRGRFTPGASADEWCERRLLARIHGYTIKRLRAEIEPVAARDFLRFLLAWQRVAADARMEGPAALDTVVGQLEGFEAPAGAWESEILPARLAGYEPSWLDDRCLAGRIAWTRLKPRNAANERQRPPRGAGALDADHVAGARARAALGLAVARGRRRPSRRAERRRCSISSAQHGASFFDELVEGTGLLRSQVEEALAELVALGLVTSDSFGGLRALLVPSGERRPMNGGRRRRRTVAFGMEDAGRWALVRRARPQASAAARRDRGGRAYRAHAARPLRRGVLAPARARGRLAAAVARPVARLSRPRAARRDPRRPLRRRLRGRAVRAARRGRHAARGAPHGKLRERGSRCRAPTRSISWGY